MNAEPAPVPDDIDALKALIVEQHGEGLLLCSINPAVSAFPGMAPSRPAHRPFRGFLGVHSRYGLHIRALTNT
jgi:hypothetical protein